jgi:hypothetical protein
MKRTAQIYRAVFCGIAALVCCVTLAGCRGLSPERLRGEPYRADESGLTSNVRPGGTSEKPFLFSNKARQVEENLGYK